jgi:hypothetical protein
MVIVLRASATVVAKDVWRPSYIFVEWVHLATSGFVPPRFLASMA